MDKEKEVQKASYISLRKEYPDVKGKYILMNHVLVVREKSIRNVAAIKSANLYTRIEPDVKE